MNGFGHCHTDQCPKPRKRKLRFYCVWGASHCAFNSCNAVGKFALRPAQGIELKQ